MESTQFMVDLSEAEFVAVGRVTRFKITSTSHSQLERLKVDATSPSGKLTPVKMDIQPVSHSLEGIAFCEFLPTEVGGYGIKLEHSGQIVTPNPLIIKTYDARRVMVVPVPCGSIGQPVQFVVDASHSGEGNLEIAVNAHGQNIVTQVHPMGGAKFGLSFVPNENVDHFVSITFNGEPVVGSPYKVVINPDVDRITVTGPVLQSSPVNRPAVLSVHNVAQEQDIAAKVEGPNKQIIPAAITSTLPINGTRNVNVEFLPREPGEYMAFLHYRGDPLPGSPFSCKVFDISKIRVREIPPEVILGKTVTFIVEASHAGPGNLEVIVNNGKVPSTPQALGPSLYAISFVVRDLQPHIVDIKFNGELVPGAPFTCNVTDPGRIQVRKTAGMERIPVSRPFSLFLETNGAAIQENQISITGPNQETIPVYLEPDAGVTNEQGLISSGYRCTFTPQDVGDHLVDLQVGGNSIQGCPFVIRVFDANRVKVSEISSPSVGKHVYFTIDASQAGAGNLEIIVSCNSRNVPNYVQSEGNAKFRVYFKPLECAPHLISVKFNGESVPGSPLCVTIRPDGVQQLMSNETFLRMASVGRPVTFSSENGNLLLARQSLSPTSSRLDLPSAGAANNSVDQVGKLAGSLADKCAVSGDEFTVLVVSPTGKRVAVETIRNNEKGSFDVKFSPTEVGPHQISILMDGTPIMGSPFSCNVYDVSKVKVTGLSQASLGIPVTFQVDASQAGEGTLELVVTTRKSSVRAEVAMKSRGLYNVTFVPSEPLPHYVNVTFNDETVDGSPFKVEILNPADEPVPPPPIPPHMTNGHRTLPSIVPPASVLDGHYGRQDISQSEQGQLDPQNAIPASCRNSQAKLGGLVGLINSVELDLEGNPEDVLVKVRGPQELEIPFTVGNTDTTPEGLHALPGAKLLKIEYTPKDIGVYHIEVLNRATGTPLVDRPILIEACDPTKVKLINVNDVVVGREQTFKVDTSRAGRGILSMSVKAGDKEVKCSAHETSDGIFTVSYVPRVDTIHAIDVRYNGHTVAGCPIYVESRDPNQLIIVHGQGLKIAPSGKPATFLIETGCHSAAARDFDILISDPHGGPMAVKCYAQQDGSLLAEWTPHKAGSHRIDVTYKDKPVSGSPFTCEVFDASKVVLQKINSATYPVNEKIGFLLNRKEAGFAELDVTVTSPLGRHLPIEIKGTANGDGEYIEFVPTVPGKYKIAITFGGLEVPGSPVTFIAQDAPLGNSSESSSPRLEGLGLTVGAINQVNTFRIESSAMDAMGKFLGKPEVRIQGPKGEAIYTVEKEGSCWLVHYTPRHIGVYDVRVLWNGRDLTGSPFHPRIVDLSRVKPVGGWDSLINPSTNRLLSEMVVGEEKRIVFDTTDAGPGSLKAHLKSFDGSLIQLPVEQISPQKSILTFSPKRGGDYNLLLYFNDFPISHSPISVPVLESGSSPSSSTDHTSGSATVVLRGHGLAGSRVNEQAEFTIEGEASAAGGTPIVTLTGSKSDIPVKVERAPDNSHLSNKITFRATYVPTQSGTYLLNVQWGGKQVKGCPLKVTISPSCDASKVAVTGNGLKSGTSVGRDLKIALDTRRAGPGELTAHCMGPNKVSYCELYDQMDGTFTLLVRPHEQGPHSLSIKYGGEHVPGSPFTVKVGGPPDASKVKASGPGLEHGVLPLYQSTFICDTRGAGAGQLTVRIRGPKGAFRVEMARSSQKDRTIACKYDPTEPGDYRIEVKWSGDHIPSSPFLVNIFDTQEELNRYLSGQISGPSLTAMPLSALTGPPGPPHLHPSQGRRHPGQEGDYYASSAMSTASGWGKMSWRGSAAHVF